MPAELAGDLPSAGKRAVNAGVVLRPLPRLALKIPVYGTSSAVACGGSASPGRAARPALGSADTDAPHEQLIPAIRASGPTQAVVVRLIQSSARLMRGSRLRTRQRRRIGFSEDSVLGHMRIRSGVEVDDGVLAQFCQHNHIARLALYGSSLHGGFSPGSDIDVLAEFKAGHVPGLLRLAQMEIELGDLPGGSEVELRTYEDLSRFFRDEVRASARQLCSAA